jgi:hypothetical protein
MPFQCLWVRPGAYPRDHLKGTLLENIRLGWNGLSGTNSVFGPLVNYNHKKFYNTGPRDDGMHLISYEF